MKVPTEKEIVEVLARCAALLPFADWNCDFIFIAITPTESGRAVVFKSSMPRDRAMGLMLEVAIDGTVETIEPN